MNSINAYVEGIRTHFEANANAENAAAMSKYMRQLFPFFGLKSPLRDEITKKYIKENGLPSAALLPELLEKCWAEPEREMQYFALDVCDKMIKKAEPSFVDALEICICGKSWWDTVDWIAPKHIGYLFSNNKDLINTYTTKWLSSNNIWLQRTAILFQLKYKHKTDTDLLFHCITSLAHSKEFFLQKASGWALREYAKSQPEVVRSFVTAQALSPLTVREALKHLK